MKSARFASILRLLAENDVELIIVGMLAGVLQGAPLTTGDVDIVHRRTPENVKRLLKVLREIDAVYRHDPRRLSPNESHLMGSGHQLLESKFGDIDCLGTIDGGKTFESLIGSAVLLNIGDERTLRQIGDPLRSLPRRPGHQRTSGELHVAQRRGRQPVSLILRASSRRLSAQNLRSQSN